MAKYKKVNEDIVDNFIDSIFRTLGKGFRSMAIKRLSEKDPEFAKKVKNLAKKRNEMDAYLKSRGVPKLTRAEKRAIGRGDYFK